MSINNNFQGGARQLHMVITDRQGEETSHLYQQLAMANSFKEASPWSYLRYIGKKANFHIS